jgi:hypothetical protein
VAPLAAAHPVPVAPAKQIRTSSGSWRVADGARREKAPGREFFGDFDRPGV